VTDVDETATGRMDGRTWPALRSQTPARIGLTRAGGSIGTAEGLQLQLAHAAARDALVTELDVESMLATLHSSGFAAVPVRSCASDRSTFIRRPDLGRLLEGTSVTALAALADPAGCDGVFILADGLSALAVARHAVPLLKRLHGRLCAEGWKLAPIVIASQSRVALSDPIGAILNARMSVILIGERPGLSSPDSLGAYLTWSPRPERTDAERNCISNIRPEGVDYDIAGEGLYRLMVAARAARLTGTGLTSDPVQLPPGGG
jgi:ethanolamine ammonia-lyase small subunit